MNDLIVKRIGPNRWELAESWQTPSVFVPKGFVTDGASVPRLFWWFASPSGDLFEASVVHDYLYKNALKTKAIADKKFFETAMRYKTNKLRAHVAYFFVRMFGKGSYK